MKGVAVLLSVLAVAAGCAARPGVSVLQPVTIGLAPSDYPTQRLIRLQLAGPRGSGSLRLVVRLAERERLQIEALDGLGRRRWRLDLDHGTMQVVDFSRRTACRGIGTAPLPDIGVDLGSARDGVEILLARLPSSLSRLATGTEQARFVDDQGRQWRVSAGVDGQLESWTALRAGRPEMWWQRDDGGGILSHRDGAQLRWRTVRIEPMPAALGDPELEPGVEMVECTQLLGQPFDSQGDGL